MRVAALNDIHGNMPALEAVLEEVRQARVDRIVVGGDVVPGPMVISQSSNSARSVEPACPRNVISYVCVCTGHLPPGP